MAVRRANIVTPLAVAIIAASAASACNAVLDNSDGDYVPDVDAAPDSSRVATADGSMTIADARAADAGGSFDAQADAAATPGYCASLPSAPAFCADFDEAESDGGLYGFASAVVNGGCSLTREATNPVSSPLSLRARTTNVNVNCYLSTQVVPTKSITVDVDVRIHALGASPGAVDAIFALETGSSKYVLYANKGAVYFQAKGGQGQNSDILPAPVLDAYHHVTMKLVLTAGAPPVISGSYDMTTVTFGGKTEVATQGPFEPGTATEVRVGLPEVVLTNTGDVTLDNVVVRVE